MHDLTELVFHAIVGVFRILWAICEFIFQTVAETGGEWLIGLFAENRNAPEKRSGTNGVKNRFYN